MVNVSDVQYHWERITMIYEDSDGELYDEEVGEIIRKRWKLIYDPIHYAGKHSDPRRLDEEIYESQYNVAIKYVFFCFIENFYR